MEATEVQEDSLNEWDKAMIGQRYGRLLVKRYVYRVGSYLYCLCDCDCGKKDIVVPQKSIFYHNTKSCGCLRTEGAKERNRKKREEWLEKNKGKRFGSLVVDRVADTYTRDRYIVCKCDCGNEITTASWALESGDVRSCGCKVSKRVDLSERRFGCWTVLNEYEKRGHHVYWKCRCDCGNERFLPPYNLLSGKSRSCGCYKWKEAHDSPTCD